MLRKKIIAASLLVLTINLSAAPAAQAQNCKSFAQIFGDIWKKWGDTIIKVGCVAGSAVATGGAIPATAALSAQCIKNSTKYKEAAEKMVSLFNGLADNGPATLGPRRIEFGNLQEGNILGPGDRTYVSVYPMDKDSVSFRLRKVEGQCRVEVIICKIDDRGKQTNLSVFEINEDTKEGSEITRTVTGVSNHLVQIRLNGITLARRLKYQLRVTK